MSAGTVMTVLEDLLEKAKSVDSSFSGPIKGEDEQVFLKRLMDVVQAMPDQTWDKLHKVSQAWFNDAAQAVNEVKLIPPCPGFQTEVVIPVKPVVESVVGSVVELTMEKHVMSPKPTQPPTNEPGRTKRGVMGRVREITLANPKITQEEIMSVLAKEGWPEPKSDTVWLANQEVKNVLKAAEKMSYFFTKFEAK